MALLYIYLFDSGDRLFSAGLDSLAKTAEHVFQLQLLSVARDVKTGVKGMVSG
jgi:hypothetical protein